MNTFHLFEIKGKRIIFFPQKGIFCEVSNVAFEVLKSKNRNKRKLCSLSSEYSFQEIKECLEEFEIMKGKELFNYSKKPFLESLNKEKILNYPSPGIVLDVAQVCNLNCKYCYGQSGSYGSGNTFMSEEIAKAGIELLLRRAKDVKNVQILFFGGEPLLNFSLIKYVVDLCRKIEKKENKKFQFSVTTNATILNDEIIYFLNENRFSIMVSFDGTKKIHNKYRPFKNGNGSFDIVTQNIKKYSEFFPIFGRGTIVKEAVNKKTIEKIIKNSQQIGIVNLILSPVDCSKIGNICFSLCDNDLKKLSTFFQDITENNLIKLRRGLKSKIIFDPFAPLIKAFYEGKHTIILDAVPVLEWRPFLQTGIFIPVIGL